VTVSKKPGAETYTSAAAGRFDDSYVWSVNVGDDGSFNFYAVPRALTASTSSQKSAGGSNESRTEYADGQYAFYASLAMKTYGRLVDVYA
jgi:hypothetical protein